MYDALIVVQKHCGSDEVVFGFFPLLFLVYCLVWQPWRQRAETPSARILVKEEPIVIKSEPVAV